MKPKKYTEEEILFYMKCKTSIEYFLEEEMKLKLTEQDKLIIKIYQNQRFILFYHSLYTEPTELMLAIFLWELIFNLEKHIMFVDRNIKQCKRIIRDHIYNLSEVFSSHIKNEQSNKDVITYSMTNSSIHFYNINSFTIGWTPDIIYQPPTIETFNAIYPVLVARTNTKMIITLSPKSIDNFKFDLESSFKIMKLYWYDKFDKKSMAKISQHMSEYDIDRYMNNLKILTKEDKLRIKKLETILKLK